MPIASAHGKRLRLKIGMVLAGYLVAFLLASIAVAVHVAFTSGPIAQASSGMYAFGDALLFVAVFGIVGLLPTGLGIVFLRPYRLFWLILAGAGVVIAATGVTALALFAIGRNATPPSSLSSWAAFAVLRILPAPLFATAFLIAGILSPHRGARWTLLAVSGIEIVVCTYAGFVWLTPLLLH